MAKLARVIFFQRFSIIINELNASVEGTQTSIFYVHGYVLIVLGVSTSEELASRRHIYE